MIELTQEILREFLDYDPDNGVLTWKERGIAWFEATEGRSAEGACNIWNSRFAGIPAGCLDTTTDYIRIRIFGRIYHAHRIIWLFMTGEFPADSIDHINGNRTDNRWCNLRDVTNAENHKNQAMRKNNTSGFKGVYWDKSHQKWKAQIRLQGNNNPKNLGRFATPEEASVAYVTAAIEAGFTDRHIFGKD